MSNHRKIIDFWLGQLYHADVLSKGSYPVVRAAFKDILAPGSQVEKEAQKKLEEVSALPRVMGTSRCYISDKQFQYLTELLK